MGIVVTVFMLLGLLLLSPLANIGFNRFAKSGNNVTWVGFALLLAGLWNCLWHGLRHLDNFWGLAALISGVLMVFAAVLLLGRVGSAVLENPLVVRLNKLLKPISVVIVIGLAFSFLLYATTLVQLNLGLPIIY